jgi:hypothetical protein
MKKLMMTLALSGAALMAQSSSTPAPAASGSTNGAATAPKAKKHRKAKHSKAAHDNGAPAAASNEKK